MIERKVNDMPIGWMRWVDPGTGHACIRGSGREYPARVQDMEPAARVPRARVHFDVIREDGVRRAQNVTLRVGTRVSPRQHRFGDLVGAGRPTAKGHAPLTHARPERDLDPGPEPMLVVRAWLEAMSQGEASTAVRLYALDARLHVGGETRVGRRKIEPHLTSDVFVDLRDARLEIRGEDATVIVRWRRSPRGHSEGETRFRIHHDQIAEQWLRGGRMSRATLSD